MSTATTGTVVTYTTEHVPPRDGSSNQRLGVTALSVGDAPGIDLGPFGGTRGGEVVAAGTPEEVSRTPGSLTGKYLRDVLERHREREEAAEAAAV